MFQILEYGMSDLYDASMLKAQDIVVLLKVAIAPPGWSFADLAEQLGMSASAVHRSLRRATDSGLYDSRRRQVKQRELKEFLAHGVRYVFPAVRHGEARGMPTAWGAEPLASELSSSGPSDPVWPDALGIARGIALIPLYPNVPGAAARDGALYRLLAVVDAIRVGGARERSLAVAWLDRLLDGE
jgi:DNA-binding Lrp family transcriptional regulator